MSDHDLIRNRHHQAEATFTRGNRIRRGIWGLCWLIFARWTPPPMHLFRVALLRLFGANISFKAHVYSDVKIWAPWNLIMHEHSALGRGVVCYNIGLVEIGRNAVVSQFVHLCTGTHDYTDSVLQLYSRPISIGPHAWICANAFVGPGVSVGEGAILGAAGVARQNLPAWEIFAGNPAVRVKTRPRPNGDRQSGRESAA